MHVFGLGSEDRRLRRNIGAMRPGARWRRALYLAAGTCVALLPLAGCAVPQPRGAGKLERLNEPTTGRDYWLYLPKDYVNADETARASRAWPLVVTFHGMKPYDIAHSQAREWQQEADRYGFIVVAPELVAFDFFTGEFPLRAVNPSLKADEAATLAIMDYLFETTHADPTNVLATSWSSGGYIAHYMLNRHPERFTCLAVRQSNFTANVLDSADAARSLYHPILIVSTQNDIPICKEESREAIKWYEGHGYRNLAWVYLNRLGHERTPDTAADFFARVCGAQPKRPPEEVLVHRQAIDGNATGLALMVGNLKELQRPPGKSASGGVVTASSRPPTPARPILIAGSLPRGGPSAAATRESPAASAAAPQTPQRPARTGVTNVSPVAINVSSAIGFEPLLLVYTAECPVEWQRSADFYWSLDGQRISRGVNGQKTIAKAGDYALELLVVTAQGAQHRAERQIRVLKNAETIARPTP